MNDSPMPFLKQYLTVEEIEAQIKDPWQKIRLAVHVFEDYARAASDGPGGPSLWLARNALYTAIKEYAGINSL